MKRSTHRWKRLARLGIEDVKYSDTTLLYEIVHSFGELASSPFIQPELVNSMRDSLAKRRVAFSGVKGYLILLRL